MYIKFTEEEEKWRQGVRDWLLNELPEDYDDGSLGLTKAEQDWAMKVQKKMCEKGWATASWPKEYGGLGWSFERLGIVDEELAYQRWRSPVGAIYHIQGPAILTFGTEGQKKKYIPAITRGEISLFQAFTEPEAGSETANVQTRAVQDGDYFILNGQKTFISGPHPPDVLYTLAKTAEVTPKHRGISLFLIPANTPGITYRPLPGMYGGMQHDIFFDDVRVHKDCLLGELNRGFYHAMTTFEFERSGTAQGAMARRNLDEFVQFCKEEKRNGKPLFEDPEVREVAARRYCQVEVMRLTGWYLSWRSHNREKLGPSGGTITPTFYGKVYGEDFATKTADILNLYGQVKRDSKYEKLRGRIERSWAATRSQHGGGTVEIYKYIVADRGFGLPRFHRRTVTTRAEEKVA